MSASKTLGAVVRDMTARLAAAGVATPGLDARVLVAAACGLRSQDVFFEQARMLTDTQQRHVAAMTRRREAREPVSRILGRRGFWTLDLGLNADTFDPRPDTETLVEAVLAAVGGRRDQPLRFIEFGCGSGAVLLALLSESPAATGLGLDVCSVAVAQASDNAACNGLGKRVSFACHDWTREEDVEQLVGKFDLIVSNPPYIPVTEMVSLEPEVTRYDPRTALVGEGADGLGAYRRLAPIAARLAVAHAVLGFEVGTGQAADVARIMAEAGWGDVATYLDLRGCDRVVLGRWPAHQTVSSHNA